jgi:hypothetical protein
MIISILGGRVAYYHAPKCGSRTLIGWAVLLEHPGLAQEHPEWFEPTRPNFDYAPLRRLVHLHRQSRHDWRGGTPPKVEAEVRLCVVRDPVERFVSGYANRVVFHRQAGRELSLAEFIAAFDEVCRENYWLGVHFLPQVAFYGRDPALFTHIFRLADLRSTKMLLEEASGRQLPDLHLQRSPGNLKPTLTPKQEDWVRACYADDYNVYGYLF